VAIIAVVFTPGNLSTNLFHVARLRHIQHLYGFQRQLPLTVVLVSLKSIKRIPSQSKKIAAITFFVEFSWGCFTLTSPFYRFPFRQRIIVHDHYFISCYNGLQHSFFGLTHKALKVFAHTQLGVAAEQPKDVWEPTLR
jgi:hypothetical protein